MRVSAAARIRVAHRAEAEIRRFAAPDPETGIRPHALWHKHVHDTTLDPVQVLRMVEMDAHRNTVDYSCRRTRKTSTKELYNLAALATREHHELGIVAPRERQAQNNLKYMTDAIRRSPILQGYIAFRSGRRQLTDTKFEFCNGSKAQTYGIMGEIDGDSLAIASLEEVDDMPQDRLLSKLLPMLGASERLGSTVKIEPAVRISGVFKGADTLEYLIASGTYHVLPVIDVYTALELGIVDANWVDEQRAQQTEGEWVRQFLCRNLAAQNHIWEKHLVKAKAVGLAAGLDPVQPLPGQRYRKRGLVGFGYDHSGHGESLTASRSCLVVWEQIGSYYVIVFARFWPAGTDDRVVENDLLGYWAYFRPDYAAGDAYGVGMLTSLNDRLFDRGLTDIDRRTIGDGASTAATWQDWPFAPIRFHGMQKHSMASMLRSVFHNGQAAIAYFDEDAAECADLRDLTRQLGNVRAEPTKADYASYVQVDRKIGDDGFDAAMAGVWALVTRGEVDVPTVISMRTQTREQLMGLAAKKALSAEWRVLSEEKVQ